MYWAIVRVNTNDLDQDFLLLLNLGRMLIYTLLGLPNFAHVGQDAFAGKSELHKRSRHFRAGHFAVRASPDIVTDPLINRVIGQILR